jgi:hypothetical protein
MSATALSQTQSSAAVFFEIGLAQRPDSVLTRQAGNLIL